MSALALVAWLALAAILLPGLLTNPSDRMLYHWLIFITSVLGTVGAALWVAFRRGWKLLILTAASVYLLVMLLRFYILSVWWQLEDTSFPEALRLALWVKWQLIAHTFSTGGILDGVAIAFYEAVMPMLQVVVLIVAVTSNRRLQGDAPRAARA